MDRGRPDKTQKAEGNIYMEDLMSICVHRGYPECHPEIIKRFSASEMTYQSGKITELSLGDELRTLNEICKRCGQALLKIRKKWCPACGSDRIISSTGILSSGLGSEPTYNIYFYECEDCGKQLISYMQL
jgi:ribosomal protein L37E